MKKFFSMLLLLCGFLTLSATLVGVNAAAVPDDSVTFSDNSYSNQQAISEVDLTNSVIKFDKGSSSNAPKYYTTGTAIRAYAKNTFTVEAKNATTLVEITLAFSSGEGSNEITTSPAGYTEPTWSGSSTSVTFTIGGTSGHRRLKGMTIKFAERSDDVQTFTVSFDTNGGSTINTETVLKDAKVEKPADPKKDGFIFAGWYKEVGCENAFDFDTETITANTTIYAKWETDPYTHAILNTENYVDKNGGKSTAYADYNGSHSIAGIIFNSNQVSNNNGNIQFQTDKGYLSNTVAISGHISSITMEITSGEFTVSTSNSALTADGANVVTLNSTNKKLVVENPNDSYFLIKVGSATGKVTSIDIAYTYVEKTTYAVAFSAGAGAFAAGKGGDVIGNIGETTTVTLPTQADLSKTAYNYSVLSGWMSGAKVYAPGESVDVTADTSFVAQYASPENITVAQALEIADLTGTTASSIKFITTAEVKSVDGRNLVLGDASTSETIVAYASSSSKIASFKVGDIVKVEGKIKTYNTTKEYDSPSFTLVTPIASTHFQAEQTKASLKIVNDVVSIRFGNAISADAFVEGATYGVVVSTDANELVGLTKASIEALIAANKGVQCTPVRVAAPAAAIEDANGNYYQFAAVIENVPAANYTTELHAVMYMIYGDQVFVAAVKTASVKSVAAAYLDGDTTGFSAGTISALEALAQNN